MRSIVLGFQGLLTFAHSFEWSSVLPTTPPGGSDLGPVELSDAPSVKAGTQQHQSTEELKNAETKKNEDRDREETCQIYKVARHC
jgi:hypothetical protein